jgi:hypothetical protein
MFPWWGTSCLSFSSPLLLASFSHYSVTFMWQSVHKSTFLNTVICSVDVNRTTHGFTTEGRCGLLGRMHRDTTALKAQWSCLSGQGAAERCPVLSCFWACDSHALRRRAAMARKGLCFTATLLLSGVNNKDEFCFLFTLCYFLNIITVRNLRGNCG